MSLLSLELFQPLPFDPSLVLGEFELDLKPLGSEWLYGAQ